MDHPRVESGRTSILLLSHDVVFFITICRLLSWLAWYEHRQFHSSSYDTAKAKVCAQSSSSTSPPPLPTAPGKQTRQQIAQETSRLTAMENDTPSIGRQDGSRRQVCAQRAHQDSGSNAGYSPDLSAVCQAPCSHRVGNFIGKKAHHAPQNL